MAEDKKMMDAIDTLLESGAALKVQQFVEYQRRVQSGERLGPSELKDFRVLESELKKIRRGDEDERPDLLTSFDEAAEYCGVSKRTISYHLKRGNISQNPDGTFNREVLDAYLKKYGRAMTPNADKDPATVKRERADLRYRVAKAKREEMAVKEAEGRLIDWPTVRTGWGRRVVMVTQGLDAMVDRLPPMIEGRKKNEIRNILRDEFNILRYSFAKHGKYCPEDVDLDELKTEG